MNERKVPRSPKRQGPFAISKASIGLTSSFRFLAGWDTSAVSDLDTLTP